MKTDMRCPCASCPFRTDIDGFLRGDRAQEIASALLAGRTFQCHKTLAYGEEDEDGHTPVVPSDRDQHCAGAMIMLERMGRPNQWMRISERLGFYNPTLLDTTAPHIVSSAEEFVAHHSGSAQLSLGSRWGMAEALDRPAQLLPPLRLPSTPQARMGLSDLAKVRTEPVRALLPRPGPLCVPNCEPQEDTP